MNHERILIVEDEKITALEMSAHLRQYGYQPLGFCASGEEAVTSALALHPDAVLMDIALEGPMDGIQAAEAIRSTWPCPVIYVTAHADQATLDRAKITEPFGYVLKPINERELHIAIEIALYRARLQEKLRESEECYRTLIEACDDGVVILKEGRHVYVNRKFLQMYGYDRSEEIIGKSIAENQRLYAEDRQAVVEIEREREKEEPTPIRRDIRIVQKDGSISYAEAPVTSIVYQGEPASLIYLRDITDRKRAERYQSLSAEILGMLNEPLGLPEVINRILAAIKRETGFDAVGVRLRDVDDFPYYATDGFSEAFVRAESYLCARDTEGEIVRDGQGNPVLECMCGNILCGRTDAALPFFTPDGSFWTNSTTRLLASTTEKDRQARTRNRCNSQGYESVALVPIRAKREIVGLLQLNDRKKDCFTLELVQFFEGISASIGVALLCKQKEDVLRERIKEVNCFYGISALLELSGISLEEILKGIAMLLPPAWQFPEIAAACIVLEGRSFQTGRFRETSWMLTSKIIVHGKSVGRVQVCYLEEKQASDQGPFTMEERHLLNAIAERIGHIAEHKWAEEELEKNRATLNLVLDTVPQSIFWKDVEGRYLGCNRVFATAVGLDDPARIVGKTDFDLPWSREEAEAYRADDREVLDNNRPKLHIIERLQQANGGRLWIDTCKMPLLATNGQAFSVLGVYEDITDRKRTQEALEHERSNLQAIFDAAQVGMLLIDENFEVTRVNQMATQLVGKDAAAMLSRRPGDGMCCIHAAGVAEGCGHSDACPTCPIRNTFLAVLRTGEAIRGIEATTRLIINGEERETYFSISACLLVLNGGDHVLLAISDITERKDIEKKLQATAINDQLTGLYNRRGFLTLAEQQMKLSQRIRKDMLLFFIDLDKMKHINDTLGHQEGDKALVEVATILKKIFRESDIIGRMGGDEFAILVMDASDEIIEVLMKRMRNYLDDRNKAEERSYTLNLSVGIARYNPEKPSSLSEFMAQADTLMYEEKRNKQLRL